ncbi:multidrug export protein EmrA [Bordetella genomosp. 9]|uniref:Multidrug export protein EmrA n=1 Tax=Bordetella genomosp. 9 TaxID=1416803 RepID=A0A261RMW5_9BORD|nr:HlyD family secretion protein [Bordetella genomosp. 9]OZI26398.1 multidrug export protein EmrA [Bordetella genomosp. 9]
MEESSQQDRERHPAPAGADGNGADNGNDGNHGRGSHGDDKDSGEQAADENDAGKAPRRRSKKPLIILVIVVIVLAIVGAIWWFLTRNDISTDDAYTEGDAVTVASKVGGYVVDLRIGDNTRVRRGDVLLRIDPRDYVAARDQAQAQVELADAQLHQAQTQLALAEVQYPAQLAQAQAQEQAAQADLANARASYQRQRKVDPRATSQQNVDTATAQLRSATAAVARAQAEVKAASVVREQVAQARALVESRQAQARAARAQLEQAELNLSYTEVRAPVDGWVTRRNVQSGKLVQAGMSLFSLVPQAVWVTANYKETQLDRMRPGDPVDIEVDAYPQLKLHGHIDSVQLGSGSRFSAFPAENATGNFVKIVQRVPVKIVIDDGLDPSLPLPLGLSVTPTVHVK